MTKSPTVQLSRPGAGLPPQTGEKPLTRQAPTLAALCLMLGLTACGPASQPTGISDPYEAQNRSVHALNTDIDRALLKPASNAYGGGLPEPVRRGVGNFASNVDLPRSVVNNILQVRPQDAMHNTLRFVVNTTVGIGGLFDPASAIGLEERKSDFGETLHVWGVGEGNYLELPALGPSTERDAVGTLVDLALNPLSYVLPSPEKYSTTVAQGLSKVGDRYSYSSTVDSILYDSADGYAQARVLYLENRRFELRRFGRSGEVADDDYFDPYAETIDDNPEGYIDPYEDLE
jgi:phospholipid-binding lipoprotein MlaA